MRIEGASCVIPAFEAEATIGRAVRSVLATPGIAEVVVVDDGSRDATGARVEAIAAGAARPVRLIRQENAGAGAARNAGMAAATGDWIAFLDADDEMLPEAITSKAAHLARCPDPETVGAVHGSFIRGDTGSVQPFATSLERVDADGIGRAGGIPGGVVSYLFRREALMATGGFRTDLAMFEDFELLLRLIAGGARVVGCDVPGFRRHYVPGSLSRGTVMPRRLAIERDFLRIAAEGRLMSGGEILRRRLRNRARDLVFRLAGR